MAEKKFNCNWIFFTISTFAIIDEIASDGRRFFYNDKDHNPFADLNNFWHLMWKFFVYFDRTNSIKTNLQTCYLQTIQSISYKFIKQFWLNLSNPNSKMFYTSNVKINPHLQIHIYLAISNFVIVKETASASALSPTQGNWYEIKPIHFSNYFGNNRIREREREKKRGEKTKHQGEKSLSYSSSRVAAALER